MEIIFIIGASQAFFLSILAFNKKNKNDGDYVLAIWLCFIAFHLLDYYLNKTGFTFEHPHLLGIGACFPLLQGPFMYVYTLVLINKTNRLSPVYLLHGLPFLVFTIYYVFDFYFLSASEKIAYIQLQEKNPYPVLIILNILIILLGPVYIVLSLIKLRKHLKTIAENFSHTEGIDLNWLKYVLGGLGFIWSMVVLTNILVKIPLITDTLSENIIYLSVAIAVFFLGYFGIKQQAIYSNNLNTGRIKRSKHSKSRRKQDTGDTYDELRKAKEANTVRDLLDYFENEKPYLNNILSLKELADELGIPVNQLSHIINERIGKNFFDFVNTYRVEEFKSRASHPDFQNYTLISIAYDSGFNSKATFNRVFKKYTGQTPSNYYHNIPRS
jgi:AraC-like DNA-binding protein